MAIYVGRWDCKYCGHTGNRGPNVHCTQCGAPRPENVTFYLPKDAEVVSCEEELENAQAGPDWVCSNCSSGNKHWDTFCGSCGSPFRSEDRDTILAEKEYDSKQVPRSGKEVVQPVKETRRKGLSPVKRGGILTAILAAVGSFLATFSTDIQVEVVGFEWERTVQVEKYIEVEEEDWEIPASGKLIKSFEDIHHYDKVFKGYETKTRTKKVAVGTERYVCGKKDLGNGYFEDKYCDRTIYENRTETYREEVYENVPVMATKYRYSIFRWKPDETLTTEGNDHVPQWGTKPVLQDPSSFRIANRSGKYTLVFEDHKGEKHYEVIDFDLWQSIQWGDMLPAKKSTVYSYFKELDWEKLKMDKER